MERSVWRLLLHVLLAVACITDVCRCLEGEAVGGEVARLQGEGQNAADGGVLGAEKPTQMSAIETATTGSTTTTSSTGAPSVGAATTNLAAEANVNKTTSSTNTTSPTTTTGSITTASSTNTTSGAIPGSSSINASSTNTTTTTGSTATASSTNTTSDVIPGSSSINASSTNTTSSTTTTDSTATASSTNITSEAIPGSSSINASSTNTTSLADTAGSTNTTSLADTASSTINASSAPSSVVAPNTTSTNTTSPAALAAEPRAIEYNTTLNTATDRGAEAAVDQSYPADCSLRRRLDRQPVFGEYTRLRKCCPIGEGLNMATAADNQTQTQMCASTRYKFKPTVIDVELFENCIEDTEKQITMPLDIGNPCNTSLVYMSGLDDVFLYVIQNGSLLITDIYGNQSASIEDSYCLDIDSESEQMYAFVCITSVQEHLKRSQILLVAILMLISIPCLWVVSYLHCALNELRTLHGLSLSLMSASLATGYFLHSVAHIYNISSTNIGYAIQFFLLSFYFWYLLLCCNILLSVWYTIPLNRPISKNLRWATFAIYSLVSFTMPMVLVIMTIQKGLPGMPSYFIQGYTQSIRESQRYFIPPVSTILFLSFVVLVGSFFGFQRIKKRHERSSSTQTRSCLSFMSVHKKIDEERYDEVKKNAKCISLLGIIMIVTWMLEIVTFYSPGDESYLIVLEMINGLQGVFILLIFLVVRRRRTIILRWWYDRGSHNIQEIEEELVTMPLNKPQITPAAGTTELPPTTQLAPA